MASKTIADAARESLASFDAIDQISVVTVPERLNNEDSRSRFKIWASNLGSMHPSIDRRSADYRLREAPEVTDRIAELLEELTEINIEIYEILSGERANRQTSESEDDTDSTDELSELHLSVGDIITSLFKVSMLVKKATKRDRYAKAASAKDDPFLAEFDIRHISDKYPKIRSQPWLLERLGRAITQRRQFLRYCRNHRNRIAHIAPTSILKNSHLTKSRIDGNLEVPTHTEKAASTTNTPLTRPTLSPTTASTLYPDKIVREDLQDLDDGDDAVSQVTSVAYSHVESEDPGLLHVPRLEDVANGGQPFECPFCFGIVQARKQRSWRKHVLSDLRAYVCMSQGCDAGLFEDKATWQAHDAECHQRQWRCQHCRVGPFSSASGLQNHLCSMHDVGELPTDILAQVVDASTSTLTEVVPDCPLCNFEDKVRTDAMNRGHELSTSAQVVVPLADYHRHLAFHQEQLALFAIPPATETSAESGSTHARSRADTDEHVQLMMRWQNRLTDTEIYSGEADDVAADSATTTAHEVPGSSDSLSLAEHGDLDVTQDAAVEDKSINMPEEDQFPTILPGDIVYIPQQTEERLIYTKAVYLGSNGQKLIAREWNSQQEVEVSTPALVRKTSVTEEERLEAEFLWATSALEGREGQVGPRHYRRNILLSSQTIDELKLRAHQLETGEVELQVYDEGLVKPIFSRFLQQVNTRDSAHGLPLEDVVRIFYATATSYFSEDNTSTDQVWKADVERSAALLMDVLIDIIREGSNHSDEEFAQIKGEHGQMIARASQAAKGARGDYIKQSVGDLQDAVDHLEINFQTLEALKVRAQDVATGQEQLPGFGSNDVKLSFVEFSRRLRIAPPRGHYLVAEIVQEFESCVLSELVKTGKLHVDDTTETLLEQKALLLSLLISVDAQLQSQHHGGAPRIRSRFTSLMMEERATYLLAISKVQSESRNRSSVPEANTAKDLSRGQGPSPLPSNSARDDDISNVSSEDVDVDHRMAPHTEPSAMERPPRVMKCYQCQHSWTSTIASDLRDCPECGSYSVFAESPHRTASPDSVGSLDRPKAPGEDAVGQYSSGRSHKYLGPLREKQHLPESKQGSHSSTDLSKASRTTQETPAADLHAIMCSSCGYRSSHPNRLEMVDCPKCSSKETFINFFPAELEGSNLDQVEGTGTSSQALYNAPPQLIRLFNDIEDLAADLQQLQDRHSSIVADVPVAVEHLLLLSAAFKLLIKLQRDPDHQIRYQHVKEKLQILCSSIQYTLDAASKALRIPLDETQWTLLCHRMKSDENVEFLQRLRWYQKSISGLNGHVDGSTRMVSPDYDATDIEVLLWRQRTIRGHQPWQAGKPETTPDTPATKPFEQSTASEPESADSAKLHHKHDIK